MSDGIKRTRGSWRNMLQRCTNPKDIGWHRYGGRGILVCQRWMESFENFLADMGERPPGMTIDRRDNDGNYEPGNCRWATAHEQRVNSTGGRRPRAGTAGKLVGIRATDVERERWSIVAEWSECTLSQWLRAIANQKADQAERVAPDGEWAKALARVRRNRRAAHPAAKPRSWR